MRKNLQIMMIFSAFAVFFACATTGFAQMPRVGGFKAVAVKDAAVVAAARFAVNSHAEKNDVSLEIVSIQKAERQVVQGTNYRLCVEVRVVEESDDETEVEEDEEGADETQFIQVVVYQDLKRVYKLNAWKPDACGN